MKRLLLGIPAYNEYTTLPAVLHSLPRKVKGVDQVDILVVDDGSTDTTGAVARKAGVIVACHLINRGLGGALRTIFCYAKKEKYDYLVTLDADGQHSSADIPHLLQNLLDGSRDVVIGSRWLRQKKAPKLRILINQLANMITYLFFGMVTSDSQSGFRAFNRKAITSIHLSTDGMEVSSEFFKEMYRHGLRYGEVAIDPIYTKYSQQKGQKLSNFPAVLFELSMRFLQQ